MESKCGRSRDPVEILGFLLASGVQAAFVHGVRISVIYSD